MPFKFSSHNFERHFQKVWSIGFCWLKQTRPLLTLEHQIERVLFCMNHIQLTREGDFKSDNMHDVVHIDEKWFFVKRVGEKQYVMTNLDGRPAEKSQV